MSFTDEYSSLIEVYDETQSFIPSVREEADESDILHERLSADDDSQERDCVYIYLRQIGRIPLLKPEEEFRLFQKIRIAKNAPWGTVDDNQINQARIRVVEGNLRLVAKIALKYRNMGLPLLDLIQEGNVGLMKAVERFEPEKGYRFTTYATWWIQQSMMRALTDHGRTIRLPAHIVERLSRLNRGREHLQQRNNEQPTLEEVAEEVSLPVEKVRQVLELSQNITFLDMSIGDGDDKDCFMDLVRDESVTSPEDEVLLKSVRERLEEVLSTLLPREAEILRLRFGLSDGISYTLEQLGRIFGITRERVRQIEKKALMKLRHPKRSAKLREFLEEPSA